MPTSPQDTQEQEQDGGAQGKTEEEIHLQEMWAYQRRERRLGDKSVWRVQKTRVPATSFGEVS